MPYLLVQVAVLLNRSYPGQHVLSVLGLEQVLTVRRGQSQGVLPLRVAVGDVDQTGLNADGHRLLLRVRVWCLPLLLVLVQIEGVATEHGVHLLPRPHAAAYTLKRVRRP